MQDKRKPPSEITPFYEDSGLFKSSVKQLLVELVPETNINARNDLVIRGYYEKTKEVAVIFAGRRMAEVQPLKHKLLEMWGKACRLATQSACAQPTIDKVRLPVLIEGAWRPHFKRDDGGWETRSFQLIAARWALVDKSGETVAYGEAPINWR